MKNQIRDERLTMKLRDRPAPINKMRIPRKKSTKEKRSPSTREFGTDLTNRPLLDAIQLVEQPSPSSNSPP